MKQFISVTDTDNIDALAQKALAYKKDPLKDKSLGAGKRMGCLFLNPSMRTRLSTQIAAQKPGNGGHRIQCWTGRMGARIRRRSDHERIYC
jgi:ornithine carbamoyltransferase